MGSVAAIGSSVAGTAGQFFGQRAQATALTDTAAVNASVAKLQAADAIQRGESTANARLLQGRRAIGAQRAGLAASGIDPNSGTAADLQADEAKFSASDAQTLRNNAAREAWGYTTQAAFNTIGAQNEASALRAESWSTLLTGATKAYGIYSQGERQRSAVRDAEAQAKQAQRDAAVAKAG